MKFYIKLVVFVCVIVLESCSSAEETPPVIVEEPNAFFNLDKQSYWEMQNTNGDVASFQALTADSMSLAMRYWDTIQYNRKQVLGTPVQFVYRENGVKRQQYFALIEEQDSLIFAGRSHKMIANYTLNFYVYLFKIPKQKPANVIFTETDSNSQPVGTGEWKRDYLAKWTLGDSILINEQQCSIWQVEYNAIDTYHTPQLYTNEFAFIENIGFYSYMGYVLAQ